MTDDKSPPSTAPSVNVEEMDEAHNAWVAEGSPPVTPENDPDQTEV